MASETLCTHHPTSRIDPNDGHLRASEGTTGEANDDTHGRSRGHMRSASGALAPRPGTPDPNDPSIRVMAHVHSIGVGVLHCGEAYHYVTPLTEGERATLVTQAMWEDGSAWKRTFLKTLTEQNASAPLQAQASLES